MRKDQLERLIANSLQMINQLPGKYNNEYFYHEVLQTVVAFLPNADAGFFFMYDHKMGKLLIEAAIGYDSASYRKTRLSVGESITGSVYQTKQTRLVNAQIDVIEAMAAMTEENKVYYEEALLADNYPEAAVSFPIMSGEEVLAVLTINSFTASFDESITLLLDEIAPYLSVLCAQYQLKIKEAALEKELELTYNALRNEHQQLQRTTDLYNNLASLMSQNKSIDQMMQAINMSTKTPVAFYDELLYPIASFGKSAEHRLPDNFLASREVQYTLSVKKWQLISQVNESILVMPVVGAQTVIGFLCAWIDEESFNDGNRLLLEYSASMLGLELMKKRSIEETHRKLAGDIFEQLITGNYSDDVVRQAKNLDLDETDYFAILICEGKLETTGFNQYFIKDSWTKWIQQAMKVAGMDGLVTQRGMDVIAFLTVDGEKDKSFARNKLKSFTKQLEQIPFPVKIGIGRVYQGFVHVRKSYADAKQCIEMLNKKKSGKVLRFSDGGIYRLLLDHDKDELDLFVHDHIGPLLECKTKKDKELLDTLLAYVTFNRDLATVTNKLSIHHNTLYYRIKRIEESLHVSFANHDEWFDISVACKIYLFLTE
ncbi:helix-turn-helix domain-containing protein [Aquibacillus salsiterrae]|uniref:Helix-turn-helix domain-containing protein n=1 Tax=Aquibacillus salsiterrae TaxID=2950439 RepID=A0A9X3WBR2_9BACI|nr:helix-turn-helix domain-containing protein [Aquibacillus salsiterrae]MDC3415828.1 helix-turn-helix domain-containing protein [Aquibacillus salsiterrae]